jgi:large subunit ribosomal protein L17
MRHNASRRKLGRKTGHRLSLFRNQLASLVASGRIVTTVSKAKELRPLAERVVTQGKRGTVHARRLVGRWIQSRDLVKKLFDEIAPRFASRAGGYLRIVKLGSRQGDGAELAVLEFVDFQLKKREAAAPAESAKGKKAKKGDEPAELAETEEVEEKPAKKKTAKPAAEKKSKEPAAKKSAAKAETKVKATAKPKGAPAGPKKGSAPKKVGGS